ncbi:hypothetical protein DITRI_Ditri12bG0098900 [Diplodiscus trichospermus]
MVLFTLLLAPFLLLLLYFIVRPEPVRIPIKNRHVFITGGSKGIGLALAQQAVSEGARVSLLARSLEKLEEAQRSIRRDYGVDVAIFAVDVRDYEAVKRAVMEAGPIDVLLVNHGIFVPQELEKQELDEVKFMIDVNLLGSFNVIKAALPLMKNRKDRGPASIALMSSQVGQIGIYGYSAYSATKFGLRGLAESLQQEVISDNIHVSIIFPSDTDTPGVKEDRKVRPELTNIVTGTYRSMMKAEEVAKKTFDGIKSGRFVVSVNFEGQLLAIATAGSSPQPSFLMAFFEVLFAGISRLVALLFLWKWYSSIKKWHACKLRKKNHLSYCSGGLEFFILLIRMDQHSFFWLLLAFSFRIKVFLFQKPAVYKCNMVGKPAVVTHVVDSMTDNLRPTRAEAIDDANALLDGSDAIILGAETLRGLYPVETVSPNRMDLAHIADSLKEEDQIRFTRDHPKRHERYVVLHSQELFNRLYGLYLSQFQASYHAFKTVIEAFPAQGGYKITLQHAAACYISSWFWDLYVTNCESVRKISSTAFLRYYNVEQHFTQQRYDPFLQHLNSVIKPTQIPLGLEDTLYIPLLANNTNFANPSPFGINGFIMNEALVQGLLDIMDMRNNTWQTVPLAHDTLGRPMWLLDWRKSQGYAWFPQEGHFSKEDLVAAQILGIPCTPRLGLCDVDEWQFFPGNVLPANMNAANYQRITARRFYGAAEYRTISYRLWCPPDDIISAPAPAGSKRRASESSGTASGSGNAEITLAVKGPQQQQPPGMPPRPAAFYQFQLIVWGNHGKVVLNVESKNGTNESVLKVALDHGIGKASGVIRTHDLVVVCQKLGDASVVKDPST